MDISVLVDFLQEAMIVSVVIFIIVFLICREFICWYYKINKIVVLMEEQNGLLRKLLIEGNKIQEKNIVEVLDDNLESDLYTTPEVSSQEIISNSKNTEEIKLVFKDGIAGSLFHKKNEYFFKGQNKMNKGIHYYKDLTSCSNALYWYLKKGIILNEGFVGTFS